MNTTTSRIMACAFVGIAILVSVLYIAAFSPGPHVALPVRSSPQHTAPALSRPPRDGNADSTRLVQVVDSERLRGIVLDEALRFPLEATIVLPSGKWVQCASDGSFTLTHTECDKEVLVEARGYRTQALHCESLDTTGLVRVLMQADRLCSVHVIDSADHPCDNVVVEWRAAIDTPERGDYVDWISAMGYHSGNSVRVPTNKDGRSFFSCGRDLLARVRRDAIEFSPSVRVHPGEDVLVRLASTATRLRFVDNETNMPLPGMDLESWSPADPNCMAESKRTDSEGILSIQASTFPLLVRRPGESSNETDFHPRSPLVETANAESSVLQITRDPGVELLEVGVQPCGARLHLIDAISGAPVRALARVRFGLSELPVGRESVNLSTALSPRLRSGFAAPIATDVEGILQLPRNPFAGELNHEPPVISIAVEGYAVARINSSAFAATDPHHIETVRLEPIQTRCLRIVDTKGHPYRYGVSIYGVREDVLLWQEYGREDGIHGPFEWAGGDLRLTLGTEHENRILGAEQIGRSPIVDVVVPVAYGEIVVQGIPARCHPTYLRAKLGVSLEGVLHSPTFGIDGTCTFQDLPAGSYEVGPVDWILGIELRSVNPRLDSAEEISGTRVLVRPGETTKLMWVPAWASESTIEGRIAVNGGVTQPFLIPIFGFADFDEQEASLGIPRAIISRRSPRISLDASGSYVIRSGDPLPRWVTVCIPYSEPSWGSVEGFQVVESFSPGESLSLDMGRLHLEGFEVNQANGINVLVEISPRSLRHPIHTFFSTRRIAWTSPGPLELDDIPTSVNHITLERPGDAVDVPVSVLRSGTTRVDVRPALRQLGLLPLNR